jgi:hypothetical protein
MGGHQSTTIAELTIAKTTAVEVKNKSTPGNNNPKITSAMEEAAVQETDEAEQNQQTKLTVSSKEIRNTAVEGIALADFSRTLFTKTRSEKKTTTATSADGG